MRYDSCRQCTKRRIICDKATPQCSKCVKKGLDCSGIGKKYRFVEQSTSCVLKKYASGKVGVKEVRRQSDRDAPKNSSSTAVVSTNQLTGVDVTSVAVDYEIDVEGTAASSSCLGPSISKLRPQQQQQQQLMPFSVVVAQQSDFPLSYTLETIKPEQMMLFDHCKHHTMITSSNVLTRIFVNQGPSVVAKVIAPYMVVYDTDNNGYRNLILPLAHHDSLVQRAVSVVSALHLSIQQPELRHNAEMGRTAILTRLRQDAMSGSSRNVSTLSTWATIIILLVGETVTGSPDFVHLFSMLRDLALLQHGNSLGSRSMSTFLDLQRRMFELHTPPLLGASHPSEPWRSSPNRFFDFLAVSPATERLHHHTIATIKRAFEITHTLAIQQNAALLPSLAVNTRLDVLRKLLTPVAKTSMGAHTLVWVYFVAAAESRTRAHRVFFHQRLGELHEIANFGNIPVALATLERIWGLGPRRRWTREAGMIPPVLIM